MPAVSAPLSSTQVGDISITYLPDGIHHVRPLVFGRVLPGSAPLSIDFSPSKILA
jgi:hypothetical protein